jgi:TRAP-type mannitol/chloroaromatic compound transport system permease large subunit
MTDPQVGMLMLGLFIFIIMLGFPIAFTLIAMGVGFGFYAYYDPSQDFFSNRVFTLLVQKTFEVTSNDVLTPCRYFCSWAIWSSDRISSIGSFIRSSSP